MGSSYVKFKLILCFFLLLELFAVLVYSEDASNGNDKSNKQDSIPFPWFPDMPDPPDRFRPPFPRPRPRPEPRPRPRPIPRPQPRPPPPPPPPPRPRPPPLIYCPNVKSCAKCVSHPCTWSLPSISCNKCSVKRDRTCKTWPNNSTFVTAENKHNIKCPSIKNDDSIIYLPSGTNKTIVVKVDLGGSKDALVLMNYRCVFKIKNKNVEVNAKLLSDTIYCEPALFSYDSSETSISVPMTVYGGKDGYFLENPDNIHIELFKCSEMGKSCKSCTSIDNKYNCGWCDKKQRCEDAANCDDNRITKESYCK